MGFENGKVLRVALRAVHAASGDQQVNTLHYDLDDGDVVDIDNDPQLLADFFRDNVLVPFKAMYDNTWTIQPVVVSQELDPQNKLAPRSQWTSGAAAAGTRAAPTDSLPRGLCGVASLVTDHIGKRYRGRLFLGGSLGEIDQSAGVWQSTLVTIWNTFLTAIPRQPDITTGSSGSTAKWGVFSRSNRTDDIDPYISPVQSAIVRTQTRYLRSREP